MSAEGDVSRGVWEGFLVLGLLSRYNTDVAGVQTDTGRKDVCPPFSNWIGKR